MGTIVRQETYKRGTFGKLFKWLFVAFNLVMALWLVSYWIKVGGLLTVDDEATRTGAAIGTTIGTTFIIFFWAAGDVVLGLLTVLTRGPKIIVEEMTDA